MKTDHLLPLGIVLVALAAILSLGACATSRPEKPLPLPEVTRIEKWKYRKCSDCPTFSPTLRRARMKGKRYYINLSEGDQKIGKLGIGEAYSAAHLLGKASKDGPLNTFLTEKWTDYQNRNRTADGASPRTLRGFLQTVVIITLTAEYKPWGHSYRAWIPHAKIRVSGGGEIGKWDNVPALVRQRIRQVAKTMYRSGYIDALKRKKPSPDNMDVAMEGQHVFVYGLPEEQVAHEINVRPSKMLDSH